MIMLINVRPLTTSNMAGTRARTAQHGTSTRPPISSHYLKNNIMPNRRRLSRPHDIYLRRIRMWSYIKTMFRWLMLELVASRLVWVAVAVAGVAIAWVAVAVGAAVGTIAAITAVWVGAVA